MPNGKPIKFTITGDERDFKQSMSAVDKAMAKTNTAAAKTDRATRNVGKSMDSAGEGADRLAGGAAKAGGALIGIGQTIGGPFGAALQAGGTGLQFVGDAGDLAATGLSAVKTSASKAAAVIKSSTIATKASAVATKAYAIAQRILNLAMKANPILLIVSLLALLVTGVIIAYKKSATFRRIVQGAWKGIKKVVSVVVAWFRNTAWPLLKKIWAAMGKANQAVERIVRGAWRKIKSIVSSVASAVRTVNGRIKTSISRAWRTASSLVSRTARAIKRHTIGSQGLGGIVSWLRGLGGRIRRAVGGAFDGISSAFRSAINRVIGMWNRLHFTIPSISIPGIGSIGGGTIWVPQIPYLAAGGIVTGPTLAMVGEAGPEAVIPLDRLNSGGNTYHIKVIAEPGSSMADAGRKITQAIAAYEGAGGRRRR